MSIFVDKKPVPITVDGVNTIYIRARMGYGIEQKVIGDATTFKQEAGKQKQTVEVNIGAYNMALLTNNILRWEGPEFGGIPCTPENIALLNDEDPLVEKVLGEIAERNRSKKAEAKENGNGHALIEGELVPLSDANLVEARQNLHAWQEAVEAHPEQLSPNLVSGGSASSQES
jgi:hypothetical protein